MIPLLTVFRHLHLMWEVHGYPKGPKKKLQPVDFFFNLLQTRDALSGGILK